QEPLRVVARGLGKDGRGALVDLREQERIGIGLAAIAPLQAVREDQASRPAAAHVACQRVLAVSGGVGKESDGGARGRLHGAHPAIASEWRAVSGTTGPSRSAMLSLLRAMAARTMRAALASLAGSSTARSAA